MDIGRDRTGRVPKNEVEAFDFANGNEPVATANGYLLFATGAQREDGPSPAIYEPSKDSHQRSLQIRNYWALLLDREQHAFDNLKFKLRQASSVTESDIDRLEDLKRRIMVASKMLEKTEEESVDTNPHIPHWCEEIEVRYYRLTKYKRELEEFHGEYQPGPHSQADDRRQAELKGLVGQYVRDTRFAIQNLLDCGGNLDEEQTKILTELNQYDHEQAALNRLLNEIEV